MWDGIFGGTLYERYVADSWQFANYGQRNDYTEPHIRPDGQPGISFTERLNWDGESTSVGWSRHPGSQPGVIGEWWSNG